MLGLLDLEIVGHEADGRARSARLGGGPADEGVANRAVEVEAERVAELIALAVRGPFVAGAGADDLMLADLVLGQLLEHVAQGIRTDLANSPRRQPKTSLGVLDEAGVGQPAGQLGESLQRPHGVIAEQFADPLGVDLGEARRRRDATEQRLEAIEVSELCHRFDDGAEAESVLPGEVERRRPAAVRGQPAQVLAELTDLVAEAGVIEQRLRQSEQFVALLRRHRVDQRLHRPGPTGEDLQQLVERSWLFREEVAVPGHELVELRILASLATSEHLVEVGEHLTQPLLRVGAERLHRTAHLLERLRRQTAAEALDEGFDRRRASSDTKS